VQEDHFREAVEHAARLRARLVRTAHDLHRAGQELAHQNELLAANRRPPTGVDHHSTAKRWRSIADQALAAADSWAADEDPPSALACPTCTAPLPGGAVLATVSSSTSRLLTCTTCGAVAGIQMVPVGSSARADAAVTVQDRSGLVDVLDGIVGRLFAVGMHLTEALSSTDGELRHRLELAVRHVDACVDEARSVALHLNS
jgi:hypothetical protein